MKGFIVWLIPKDDSGIHRNKRFLESNHGKLPMHGHARLMPDGRVECKWYFENPISDFVQQRMAKTFTDTLDEAIKREDNMKYQVEFIP